MRNLGTMTRRELSAYFLSPIAYAAIAIFLFCTGLAFALGSFQNGAESSMRSLFQGWITLFLLLVLPMLTMRLMSEEYRGGTIESLMTAPVTDVEVILGKFFGAFVFYLVLLATLLLYPMIMASFGRVDWVLLFCNYLGLLLMGGLFIAVGLFFSTCTKHQVVAALCSMALLAFMTFAFQGLSMVVEGWPKTLLLHLSVRSHFEDFVRGLFDINHVIFFVTTMALFLFLAVKTVEFRRWR